MNKVAEGRPHIVDMIKNDEIALVINTVEEKRSAIQDRYSIRREALLDQRRLLHDARRRARRGMGMRKMRELTAYCDAEPAQARSADAILQVR